MAAMFLVCWHECHDDYWHDTPLIISFSLFFHELKIYIFILDCEPIYGFAKTKGNYAANFPSLNYDILH